MNPQSRKLNIGIIGGGEGATKALSALNDSKIVRIGAVVCKDNELTHLIDKSIRVSLPDLFNRPDIDAVYVATPNNTHIDLAIDIISAGKHVMIEKPLAVSVFDASRLIPFNFDNIVIAVAFKKRYGDGIRYLKKQLDAYEGGVFVKIHWYNPYPYGNWRCDSKVSGGGVIIDLGSHVFDLLEFLLGKIVEFEVEMEMSASFADIDKAAQIRLNFENAHSALIDLSWVERGKSQKYSFSFSDKEIHLQRDVNGTDVFTSESKKDSRKIIINSASEYIGLFSAWSKSILESEKTVPDLDDGMKNQSIIEAIYSASFNKIHRLSYSKENYYEISN